MSDIIEFKVAECRAKQEMLHKIDAMRRDVESGDIIDFVAMISRPGGTMSVIYAGECSGLETVGKLEIAKGSLIAGMKL